jgi:hypothetical protein
MNVVQINNPVVQINTQIERVRGKRQSSINLVEEKLARLASFQTQVNYLESERFQLLHRYPQFAQLLAPLEQSNLSPLNQQIERELKAWQDLLKRCSRSTINFGVAGAARQGKSTFLQRITGLGDGELPTSNGLPCTSVQSNIYHDQVRNCAIVKCFSESEFLDEIIRPYYHKLGFSVPVNLDEFGRFPLPPRPLNPLNPSESEALYNHLSNYYTHLSSYRQLLKPDALSFEIERDDIARYVSQQYNHLSQPVNFEHLAVSEVDIYCKFPNNQVANIGFVDTIGLGDTRLGDTERLMSAVGQEVDFIILIRRAQSCGDLWSNRDIELYDRSNQALLNKLPLAQCSAMVFNLDDVNQNSTKLLKDTMSDKGIEVSQTLEINCNDSQATSKVLQQLLTYLANNIEALDRQYMKECERSYQALQTTIQQEIERIQGLLAQFQSSEEQFIRLCEPKIDELYSKVENLRRQSQSTSSTPDAHLQSQINSAIQKCQAIPIADLSQLSTITDTDGCEAALRKGIEILRPQLLGQFHGLDVSLNQSLGQQKDKLATMLAEWCLNKLSDEQGIELLAEMAGNLPTSLTNLQLGFKFLTDFEIQYRGLIQSEIYKGINLPLPADKDKPIQFQLGSDLASIQAELEARRTAALENCRESLEDLSQSLHEASISMLEEWAAHITQADGVRKEWRIFLSKYRDEIWEDLQVVGAIGQWLERLAKLAQG